MNASHKLAQLPAQPASAPLPPYHQALVDKRAVIATLTEQLGGHQRRLEELRPKAQAIAELRVEGAKLVDEYQALRAAELRGESVSAARLGEIDRRRRQIAQRLTEQADESVALARAITRLEADARQLGAAIEPHLKELPALLAAAARERTVAQLKSGRLRQLLQHIATELADIYAGAMASDVVRSRQENVDHIAPCLLVGDHRNDPPEVIRLPRVEGVEWLQAMREATVSVGDLMEERARAVLAELEAG